MWMHSPKNSRTARKSISFSGTSGRICFSLPPYSQLISAAPEFRQCEKLTWWVTESALIAVSVEGWMAVWLNGHVLFCTLPLFCLYTAHGFFLFWILAHESSPVLSALRLRLVYLSCVGVFQFHLFNIFYLIYFIYLFVYFSVLKFSLGS